MTETAIHLRSVFILADCLADSFDTNVINQGSPQALLDCALERRLFFGEKYALKEKKKNKSREGLTD